MTINFMNLQQEQMKISSNLVNGNEMAKRLIEGIKQTILQQRNDYSTFYSRFKKLSEPQLHIINVGFDDASLSYIKKKIDLAKSIGIKFQLHQYIQKNRQENYLHHLFEKIQNSSQKGEIQLYSYQNNNSIQSIESITKLISQLNKNMEVSGILLQLPLQPFIKSFTNQIIQNIDPIKDVDCLTLSNRSKIIEHVTPDLLPCTPQGVMKILDEYKIDVQGKKVVIAGRSSLVGLPLFHILLNRNATITLCHSHTQNLNVLTKQADIVIAAVGKPNLITQIKSGSIAIDIGINRDDNGKLCGDILKSSKEKCQLATPVPGGVGPLTVAMLMQNTVKLWRRQMRQLQSEQ